MVEENANHRGLRNVACRKGFPENLGGPVVSPYNK